MIGALANTTRTDAAYRALAAATERLRRLEQEAQAAFAEYQAARELARAEGLTVDVELSSGIASAFAEWRRARAAGEGRKLQEARPA